MWAWVGRSLAIAAMALFASGCQTTGTIGPVSNVSDLKAQNTAQIIPASTPMPSGVEHGPVPPGFVSFCMRFSSQCEMPASQLEMVALTADSWGLLGRVNRQVNSAIWPEDDEKHYGRGEFWTIPTDGYGDCEDYALTKRKTLIDAGLPERALRIGIVVSPRDASHAVLTVATDKGDYVLDSLSDDVVPWNQTGYRWLERQAGDNVTQWVALDVVPIQLATAAH